MNNCNLDKLLVKPGKISPKYQNDIYKYDVILGVLNNKTVLDFYTEDSGASYQILVEGGDGSKTIEVAEGGSKIVKIEVTAEDGKTTRTYLINLKRHSVKAAIIELLKISKGKLLPDFSSEVYEYSSVVGLKVIDIAFDIQLPDTKCKIEIDKEAPKTNYPLTMGCTVFRISVTSPDGTNTKVYTISVAKKYNPYYIFISNAESRLLYEDSISLSPCFNAVKINELYSWDFVSADEAKQLTNLRRNTHSYSKNTDENIEKTLSGFNGQLLKENLLLSESLKIYELGLAFVSANTRENISNVSYSFSPFNDSMNLVPEWQKNFCMIDSNQTEKDLVKAIEEAMTAYMSSRPTEPVFQDNQIISHETPSKKLSSVITFASMIIALQKSQSKYHFMLAQLLEENYLLADMFNVVLLKTDTMDTNNKTCKSSAGINNKAVFSAKQDEILAICKLHGITGNPSDAEQLKSLDLEYHSLISQNQSTRADAIQNLFEWKSKQTTSEGVVSSEVSKEGSLIGQAFNKYLAALSLDKKSCVYNFHVGRLLLMQGKYREATERLNTALSCNNNHIPSKYCLGIALSHLYESEKSTDAVSLILDAFGKGFSKVVEEFIVDDVISSASQSNKTLLMDDEQFFHLRNPLISKGLLQLGKLLMKTPQPKIEVKPFLLIHWALHLAVGGWTNVAAGNTQIYFESTIIECHRVLLTLLDDEMENIPDNISVNRCLWLLNFIRSCSVPINQDMTIMQEELSKVPLFFDPGNEHFLAYYGESLSLKADQMMLRETMFKSTIDTAVAVLLLALKVKTKKSVEEAVTFVKNQAWYKSKDLIIFKSKSVPNKQSAVDKKYDIAPKVISSPNKDLPTKTPIAPTPKKPAPVVKKGPIKPAAKDTVSNKDKNIKKVEEEKIVVPVKIDATEKLNCEIKRSLAHGRDTATNRIELLLARAYCINKQYVEGVKYYKMAGIDKNVTNLNDLIQEYIDVLIAADDHNSALEIYLKLPVNEKNPTFDDGYICGEIVRLIMKTEKYKDRNLIKYASLWAQIFGFAILEKEIKLLEDKNETNTCKEIYASLHRKKVDDPELQMFFRSKCWI